MFAKAALPITLIEFGILTIVIFSAPKKKLSGISSKLETDAKYVLVFLPY